MNTQQWRIMVDELRSFPQKANTRQGQRWFGEGKRSCHMTITPGGPLEELHKFAESIGLKREWFQADKVCPHYDLMPSRRERALRNGAVFVEARAQVIERRLFRQRMTGEPGMQSWDFIANAPANGHSLVASCADP